MKNANDELVTKGYLKEEFKTFRKEFKNELMTDFMAFFETSVTPLLDRILAEIEEIKDVTNNHERRLDKHDDKLLEHNRQLKNLLA